MSQVHPKCHTPFRLTIATTIVVRGRVAAYRPKTEQPSKTLQVPLLAIISAATCLGLMSNLAGRPFALAWVEC